MNKFKEKVQKSKEWVKTHAKGICIASATVVGGAALWLLNSKHKNDVTQEVEVEPENYGRDCTMKFIVDETGEELGEAKCTESFANDFIDLGK